MRPFALIDLWSQASHLPREVRSWPDKQHFRSVTDARRFTTPYASALAPLWEPGAVEWRLVWRLPDYAPRRWRSRRAEDLQLRLLETTAQPG